MRIFVIEDEFHADWQGEYTTFDLALAEINRRTKIPWNEAPNVAPCTSWKTCGRAYIINEYEISSTPWALIESTSVVEIDANGIRWEPDFSPN